MSAPARDELEERIHRHWASGDMQRAAEVAIRGYGREVFGFLAALCRDIDTASEVFSDLSELLWRNLPGFNWSSSFRTWIYVVARSAYAQRRRADGRRARRLVAAESAELERVVQEVRSETLPHLRTEPKARFRRLRETLAEDDQMLLVLRVDRGLAWDELAQVFEGRALDGEERKRVGARLRKRFQSVKDRLRELGREQGLIADEAD